MKMLKEKFLAFSSTLGFPGDFLIGVCKLSIGVSATPFACRHLGSFRSCILIKEKGILINRLHLFFSKVTLEIPAL